MTSDDREFQEFHERFRANLRRLRQSRNLLQQEVVVRTLGDNVYRLIEQGYRKPSFETLFWLARAFGVRPADLLDVEDLPPETGRVGRGGPRFKGRPATERADDRPETPRPKSTARRKAAKRGRRTTPKR